MTSPCCQRDHPFDVFSVNARWWPESQRCLIIGESPGGPDAHYFYDSKHPVRIRRNLLMGLTSCNMISSETLDAFKNGGFLFDHAVRCQLPVVQVKHEWRRSIRYESSRAANAAHLSSVIKDFQYVWIMGYLARNAVACLDAQLPRDNHGLATPYLVRGSRTYFVSRYLLNISDTEVVTICGAFKAFAHGEEKEGQATLLRALRGRRGKWCQEQFPSHGIMGDLKAALEQFRLIANDLGSDSSEKVT